MTLIDIESNIPSGPGKEQGQERLPLLQDHHVMMMGKESTASYLSGVFNLSCTIIGAGIMSLPFAMKVLGVIPGVLLVLISGFLTKYSIEILLRFSENADVISGSTSSGVHHPGVLEERFGVHWFTGNVALYAVFFAIGLSSWGALVLLDMHTIQNELEDPSQIQGVVKSSLAVCGMVYILIGLFGFLLFGDSTASDMLSNFDSDLGVPNSSVLNTVVCLSYAAHIILVFPVGFYALRLNFDGLLFNSAIPIASDDRRFASTTLGLILVILLGAICVPSIWVAFQFTGATAGSLISFIFPASIALRLVIFSFVTEADLVG
ncbi:hypothetical protein Cgig2_007659 [Carnegiea gigantea]|uniref:Amino acid transporter transmembrane domain-containing protein n=1 Tax=Carnegiea gigantea TaxID=171969 RepID=A0A9Q1K2K4_9CARY|nr:hypothetical protein Cgig2_007659 [Carnegiea gigantea]